ncbi:hypothetical protein DRQ25_15020 [Candidatus Fermentibacteria bacterium]|nr:MAG: hypothetical protein DRQ25_15020 [Candidatus Fermentibacteria bacterium]
MAEDIRDTVRAELNAPIDENNLLHEWKGQAALMLEYGIQLADAMQEADEAKAKLAVVAAELARDIRDDPVAYGIAKATESTVPNAVLEQPEHKVALKRLNAAWHTVRVLKAAENSLAHRKSTLQGMTDLFLRQWYADPTSPDQPAPLKDAAREKGGKTVTRRTRRRAKES